MLKTTMTLAVLAATLWTALPATAAFITEAPGGVLLQDGLAGKHGKSGCDTPRDIAEHPECRA